MDNVIFVQEAQALLTLGLVKESELFRICYPECVAHVVNDLMDGRERRVLSQITPSSVMHEKTIEHQTVGNLYLG